MNILAITLLSFLCCIFPKLSTAQFVNVHVEVDGGPGGKGLAVSRGLDCFVITALHIVDAPFDINVISKHRKRSPATKVYRKPEWDLAVIRVKNPKEICNRDWYIRLGDLEKKMQVNRTGFLKIRLEDGTEQKIALSTEPIRHNGGFSLEVDPHFPVYTQSSVVQLGERHSGSIFYLDGLPAGMLVTVQTQGRLGGTMLRFDYISEAIAKFLPLERPSEYDDQTAMDVLYKSLNYLETQNFCRNLWKLGKFVARPDRQLQPTAKRRSPTGNGYDYDIDSLLIPNVNSIYSIEKWSSGEKYRAVLTTIGVIPTNLELDPIWRQLENSVNRCMSSDTNKEIGEVRLHGDGMRRHEYKKISMWKIARETSWPLLYDIADVWLVFGVRELNLKVWTIQQ